MISLLCHIRGQNNNGFETEIPDNINETGLKDFYTFVLPVFLTNIIPDIMKAS